MLCGKSRTLVERKKLAVEIPRRFRLFTFQGTVEEIFNIQNAVHYRLAYNGIKDIPVDPVVEGSYSIGLEDPTSTPPVLTTLNFKPCVYQGETATNIAVIVSCHLEGTYAAQAELTDFVALSGPDANGYYKLERVAEDITMSVMVTLKATLPDSSTIENSFSMRLFGV